MGPRWEGTMGGIAPSDIATSMSKMSGRCCTQYHASDNRSCRFRRLRVAERWVQKRRPVAYSLKSLLLTRSKICTTVICKLCVGDGESQFI